MRAEDGMPVTPTMPVAGPRIAYRQLELLIAQRIIHALGQVRTALNVGAGAGSLRTTRPQRDCHCRAVRIHARSAPVGFHRLSTQSRKHFLSWWPTTSTRALSTFFRPPVGCLMTGFGKFCRVTQTVVILTCDLSWFKVLLLAERVRARSACRPRPAATSNLRSDQRPA